MKPLQTTCLNGVSHQHAMQDLTSSATLHHPAPGEAIGDWILPANMLEARSPPGSNKVGQALWSKATNIASFSDALRPCAIAVSASHHALASQRSLHNAPIFRLLLKVAVNGTHQCDYSNFCGDSGPQHLCVSPHRCNVNERRACVAAVTSKTARQTLCTLTRRETAISSKLDHTFSAFWL